VAAGTYGPETGNVLTGVGTTSGAAGADTVGADNAHISGVTGFNGSVDNDATGGFVVNGQYGVLTLQSDGSYSYTRNPGTPGGVNDVFNYTLTDGDGDTSTTTLTINIGDLTPQTGENPLVRFDDDALPGGNPGTPAVGDDSPDTINASGTLSGSGGDGPLTFAVQTTGAPSGFSYVSGGAGVVLIQQGGHTVLTVTVSANGSYSVVQNAPIDHPAGGDENNDVFTINYSVTDQDGDSAPGSFNINVDDDTPTVSLVGEGEPQLTVDETNLAVNDTQSFASKFAVSFGADGPAASNPLVYTLGINAPGADSGLIDVATGQHVLLSINGSGVVEGRTAISGDLVFTVSVDGSGNVTLDQIRALTHPDSSNPNDNVTLSADNLVTLTATATDHDGDTASQTLNIGTNLNFHDDGPSISGSTDQPTLTVDETVLATNASASFAGVFTSSFGADGAGTITYALGISAPGADSGLIDTLSGQHVLLSVNGGVVEGRTAIGGDLVFTVSVDAGGNVTLDQIRAVVHPDASNPDDSVTLSADSLVSLTATVTDRDGDHQSATLNIGQNLNFEDDGPSITLSGSEPSLTVDESFLAINAGPTSFASAFAPAFGADGPASSNSLTYALGINAGATGLTDTATGEAVVLVNNGGVIEGRTSGSNLLVFTVTVDASGNVSLDQLRAVVHPNTANPDDSVTLAADNLITLTATAHDGDGDTASATLNIGQNLNFEDDGPHANNDTDVTSNITDTADGNVITGVGTNEGAANADQPGADGFGSITNLVGFNGSTDGNPAGGFSVNGQFGTLQMDASGNYTYTRTGGAGGATDTFTYTYVDKDGDPATATLTITLADNTPVAGTVNVGLDDDALAGGNSGGTGDDPDSVNATGNLPGSGGDAPLTFGVLLTGAPAGFSYVSGGAGIVLVQQGGVTVLTVTVNSTTGAYSVVQNAPINHAAGGDENNQPFTITYTVTDTDNDVANGSINISVDDDTPTVSANAGVQLDDDALAGGNSGGIGDDANATNTTGTLAHSYGADGAGSIAYLTTGAPAGFSYALQGNGDLWVLQGATHVLTLTVNASTGAYTVTQVAPIDHPAGLDENNVSFTISYNVTDHDGDSATGSIVVNVDDDTPTVSANAAVQLDDDALAGGNSGGTGDDANATNTTGTLGHSYGADGAGSIAYLTTGAPAGFSYALQANGDLWVLQGATHVLTLTVNSSTGAYTVTQVAPILHAAGGDENNQTFTISYNVTDHDGDSATGSIVVNVDDDTPTAAVVTTGQHVSVDESVGVQADSNDVVGPLAVFAGVANKGVDPDMATQFAANANAIVASTGSSYGADGAGTTTFSLNVSSAGVDSGLNTTDGHDILLFLENGIVVGRVSGGADDGKAAFAISIDSTGHISMVEWLSIQHADASNPDDVASITNGAVLAVVTVTDADGDPATSSTAIGSLIQFQDSGPVLTAVDNINIQNSGDVAATGGFHYLLGADGAPTNNDVFKLVTGSATVNGDPVSNYTITQTSENATSAVFTFSFDYDTGTGGTAHETGTLTFDKSAGTYTVDLQDPISGFSILSTGTADAGDFVSYQVPSGGSGAPEVTVAQLDTDFFVQFSGVAEPGAGTGSDNLFTTQGTANAFSPVTTNNFANLELFTQAMSTVQVSSTAAGVAGNTIQGGEVLDFNLYATDPGGTLGGVPTTSSTSMFIQLDGIGGSEDMIVVLKLLDTSTGQYTTQAIMVQNADIITSNATLAGTAYSGIVLDNNDGLIVIEANDYQNGNTNLVIVGAQIAGSDEGITGTATNLNGALGAAGGSSGTQAFSTDVSDAPFKITSIGFLTTTSTDQNADLTFNVTIQDGDGDTVTQTIHATVTASADSTSAISLSPSVTTVAPVVLDLNGDGVHFLATDSGVHYNYGSGSVSTAWVSPQDGILVNDANHDGNVSASEFVFGGNGVTDLQALAAFDSNHDGQLSSADANFGNFAVWQDANSNGAVDAGELQSLTARGIASISLSSDGISYSAAGGDVQVAGTGSYTRTDGSTGVLADAAFLTESRSATNSVLMGALAAAGIAAESSAAATTVATLAATTALTGIAAQHTQAFAPVAVDAVSGNHSSDLLPNGAPAAAPQAAASHASDAGAANGLSVAGSESQANQAPAELLQNSAPVQDAGAGSSTAASIIMPAAAQLVAAAANAGVSGAQHNQVIGQVLADALHGGGGGPDIDSVLSSLPSQGGAHSALEALASHAGAAVPNGDSSAFAGFTAANAAFTMEHMMAHVDAAPTHA